MAIKFEKLQPGMVLWDIHSERAGNTTMRRLGCWDVRIVEVHADMRRALVSWNGNAPKLWYERDLKKLYVKIPPKMAAKMAAQRW